MARFAVPSASPTSSKTSYGSPDSPRSDVTLELRPQFNTPKPYVRNSAGFGVPSSTPSSERSQSRSPSRSREDRFEKVGIKVPLINASGRPSSLEEDGQSKEDGLSVFSSTTPTGQSRSWKHGKPPVRRSATRPSIRPSSRSPERSHLERGAIKKPGRLGRNQGQLLMLVSEKPGKAPRLIFNSPQSPCLDWEDGAVWWHKDGEDSAHIARRIGREIVFPEDTEEVSEGISF